MKKRDVKLQGKQEDRLRKAALRNLKDSEESEEEDEEDDSEPFLLEEFEETDDKIEIIYTLKKKENN